MTDLTLFLFDVDGVLIHPKGYKEALRDSLDHIAALMGQKSQNLTYEEIGVFESCGLTNEWDSLGLCTGLLLTTLLNQHSDSISQTLEKNFREFKTTTRAESTSRLCGVGSTG